MLIVIAIGGNMISDASNKTETFEQQLSRVNSTAELISKIIQMGHDVVITHGNGPQVGSLLLQQEEGIDGTIKLPLSVLTACTQGLIGVMLQHALSNQFRNDGIEKNVLIIPATMIVDKSDPAFSNPTKPVGPYFNITDLYESGLKSDGKYQEFPQGYRKVVPSPIPTDILELPIIDSLLQQGTVVITAGGGGTPTVLEGNRLQRIDGVIDKDLASALLARKIDADILVILTNVDGVYLNYGRPSQQLLPHLTAEDGLKLIENGDVMKGSMAPKVLAAINFSSQGKSIITSPDCVLEALEGKAGTVIHE